MSNPWTIPFDGINYVCWKSKEGLPMYRKMTLDEERDYFSSSDKEQYLRELLRI